MTGDSTPAGVAGGAGLDCAAGHREAPHAAWGEDVWGEQTGDLFTNDEASLRSAAHRAPRGVRRGFPGLCRREPRQRSRPTAADARREILGHIDTVADQHRARLVHNPSLQMRARPAHVAVRASEQPDASRAMLTRGLHDPEADRAGLRPQPRRLCAGWQLRDTRRRGSLG